MVNAGAGRSSETFRPDGIIYAQGDRNDALFLIRKGQVKLAVTSESGKDAVLGIRGPGEFFGECCLTGRPHRDKTATAISDCVALRIDKAAMERELAADPDMSALFVAHLLERNISLEEDLAGQLFHNSEKRLARTLLALADIGEDHNDHATIANISQETLAEMVGTTRSRVSFFMNKFRRLGLVAYKGNVHGAVRVNTSLLNAMLRDTGHGD